jgi:hypothetical protein
MVKREKLKHIEFSEKSYKFRKFLSVILFLAMLIGWSFLIGYNIYIAFATAQIRVHPQGFSGTYSPTNITVGGTFIIENDHWNSIAIRDLNVSYSIYTDNGTKVMDYENVQDAPNHKNTSVTLDFMFVNVTDMTPAEFWILYTALNETTSLTFDLSISLKYGLYAAYVYVNLTTEWGGFP